MNHPMTGLSVTVLTASIPERAHTLTEAVASVNAQTLPPQAHLIGVDHAKRGAPHILNELAATAATEWLCVLDDDDTLLPHHLETLLANSDDADVIYAWCEPVGHDFRQYNQRFAPSMLQHRSIVSHTALFRRDLWVKVEGWVDEWGYDWRFWQRCLTAGARFRSLPEVTWRYVYHGKNQSVEGVAG